MIMTGIGWVLLLIAGIIDLILVVKIFKQEGAMKGILAFFCFIYAYIWGWQHAKAQNLGKMMWAYTICFIIGMIFTMRALAWQLPIAVAGQTCRQPCRPKAY